MAKTPWTALTALLGIALGVASTVAVHLISLAVSDSVLTTRPPHLRQVTHIAEWPGADMNSYFELRRHWRQVQRPQTSGPLRTDHFQAGRAPAEPVEGVWDWLREVEFMTPIVEGQLALNGRRFQVVGADWLVGAPPPGLALTRQAVVADSSLGLVVNEALQLNGERWTVVRTVDSGVSLGLFVDIGDAMALLQRSPDTLSFVALRLAEPGAGLRTWLERLLPGLSAGLPAAGAEAVPKLPDWRLQPVASILPEQQFSKSILFNLGALGMLALLVAWFLIYQVCVLWLRQQETLLLRLHAIGFSANELVGGFLLSVAALGAIATLVGIFGGYGLAALLVRISTAGFDALPAVDMSAVVVAKALISGLGVAVAGAWLAFAKRKPSAEASSRSPTRVLERLATEPGIGRVGQSRADGQVGHTVLAIGRTNGWLTALGALGGLMLRRVRPPWLGIGLGAILIAAGMGLAETGLYGGFAAILAAGLIAAALVAPLLRLLRRRLHNSGHNLLARLAVREATWHEGDLSAALGALILAVGASVGVSLMVDSFERDFARMLEQRLAHETFLELPNQDGERLAAALRSAHPAALVQAYGRISTRLRGQAVELGYTDFSAAETARYGYRRPLAENEAFASESLLVKLGLSVGDSMDWNPPIPAFLAENAAVAGESFVANSGLAVENAVDSGGTALRIVHEFPGFGETTPRLLMNARTVARRFGDLGFDRIGLSGIDMPALEGWLRDWAPGTRVRERAALRSAALEIFDRTFAITRALAVLALIIAVIGLYNAMTALRLNQKAGVSLLRALGLSAAEQRRLALIRGGVLGACAILLALPLGLFIGFALCDVINPRAFGWSLDLSISAGAWAWPMLLGFTAAVVASVMPTPGEAGGAN